MAIKGSTLNRKATCHPEEKHYAHGLCALCYQRRIHDRPGYRVHRSTAKWTNRIPRDYGITAGEYVTLVQEQCNACAVCGQTPVMRSTERLAIDHNHTTGLIRGLVCHACNLALGHLERVGMEKFQSYLSLRDW